MKSWSITEARARISEVFDDALTKGPQRIERRDSEPVVIVAESVWKQFEQEFPSFADIVLNAPLEEEDLSKRRPARVLSAARDT